MVDYLAFGAAMLLVLAAAWDVRSYRIPNALCGSLAALFLLRAVTMGPPYPVLPAVIGVVAFIAGCILFARGLLGGGDVKLLAAAVIWVPSPSVPAQISTICIGGGLFALILVSVRGALRHAAAPARAGKLPRVLCDGAPVPYGVAIAAGTLPYLPLT